MKCVHGTVLSRAKCVNCENERLTKCRDSLEKIAQYKRIDDYSPGGWYHQRWGMIVISNHIILDTTV